MSPYSYIRASSNSENQFRVITSFVLQYLKKKMHRLKPNHIFSSGNPASSRPLSPAAIGSTSYQTEGIALMCYFIHCVFPSQIFDFLIGILDTSLRSLSAVQAKMMDEYQVEIWFQTLTYLENKFLYLIKFYKINFLITGKNVLCIIRYNLSPETMTIVNYSLYIQTEVHLESLVHTANAPYLK